MTARLDLRQLFNFSKSRCRSGRCPAARGRSRSRSASSYAPCGSRLRGMVSAHPVLRLPGSAGRPRYRLPLGPAAAVSRRCRRGCATDCGKEEGRNWFLPIVFSMSMTPLFSGIVHSVLCSPSAAAQRPEDWSACAVRARHLGAKSSIVLPGEFTSGPTAERSADAAGRRSLLTFFRCRKKVSRGAGGEAPGSQYARAISDNGG
jgi:hypothetical protein